MSEFTIDREACAGHGRCYALAPESFDADDMGYGVVREDAPERTSGDPGAIAHSCPEGAILLTTTAKDQR
jgi:ferredoxin